MLGTDGAASSDDPGQEAHVPLEAILEYSLLSVDDNGVLGLTWV